MSPQTVILADRARLSVSGPDAEHFLQNLVTTDLDTLAEDGLRAGALLSPQGKILFDFLLSRSAPEAFHLETRADTALDFLRRLTLYRLRAKIEIVPLPQELVVVSWGAASESADHAGARPDTRFPPEWNVRRGHGGAGSATDSGPWHALRVAAGVAESGTDYALGEAFPHDVLLDANGGVGFRKGCYVGQEVVSRMHHRGTARRRVMILSADRALPATGTEVTAAGRPLGMLGTVAGSTALAILRIDRLADALAQETPVLAGEVPVRAAVPPGAPFALPAPGQAAADSA